MSEIVTFYKCDSCGTVITDESQGLVIHGNIYTASPNNHVRLIGSKVPKLVNTIDYTPEPTCTSVLCRVCFMSQALPGLKITSTRGLFDADDR